MNVWILEKDVIGVLICYMKKCLRKEILGEGDEDRGIIEEKVRKEKKKMKLKLILLIMM